MYILLCVLPSLNKGFTYLLTRLRTWNHLNVSITDSASENINAERLFLCVVLAGTKYQGLCEESVRGFLAHLPVC